MLENEIKSVFIEDLREKKQIAKGRSAKHRGKLGTKVTTPSDFLSEAERKAMNGEVFVYKIGEPISWAAFKSYPKEQQQAWINAFAERFQCSTKGMAMVFGIAASTINNYVKKKDMSIPKSGSYTEAKGEAIQKWLGKEETPAPQPVQEEPKKPAKPAEPVVPYFVDTLRQGNIHLTGTATEIFQTLFGIFKTAQLDVTLEFQVIQPQPVQDEVEAPEPVVSESELVDVNQCRFDDLVRVGFHHALAKNVVERRPFKTLDDLRSVPGMNHYAFQVLSPKVKV